MPSDTKPSNMVCPKCGKFQRRAAECVHCGVIVAKYREAEERRAEETVEQAAASTRASSPGVSLGIDFAAFARIATFALFAGLGWYLYSVFGGDAQYEQLRQEIHSLPGYSEIKRHDPAAFAELERMVDQAQQQRWSAERVYEGAKGIIMKSVMRFIPTTSDAAINDFARLFTGITRDLERRDPSLCYQLLFQQASLAKVQRAGDQAKAMEVLRAVAEIIRAAAESPQAAPKRQRVEPVINAIAKRLADKYGSDLMFVQNPQLAAHDKKKQKRVCEISNDLYAKVLAKTPASSSRVLRYLMAQGAKR